MRICAALAVSFVVFIFHTRISNALPFQTQRLHREERRRVLMTEDYSVFLPSKNWTILDDQRSTTLDIYRGHTQPTYHEPTRIRRNNTGPIRVKKQSCVEGFCEEVENYPEALIKRVLESTHAFDSYFKESEVTFELNNRGAFDEEEDVGDTMCSVKSMTIYPKTAKNIKNEDRILVNVDNHRQGMVFETCSEKASCRFSDSFPTGFVSECKQKYVRRSLAVLNTDKENTEWDTFEVPSCCVCVIKTERNGR